MRQIRDNLWPMRNASSARSNLPDPVSAPELFDGLLTRRVVAYFIDVALMGGIVVVLGVIGFVLGFLTLGLSLLSLVFVIPAAIVLYYAVTLGSPKRATVGMQTMDIVLTPTRGKPLDGWMAVLHALIFWVTAWISLPVSLIFALFTPRRQMIHDLIVGTLMVRHSPMLRHWQSVRMREPDDYADYD